MKRFRQREVGDVRRLDGRCQHREGVRLKRVPRRACDQLEAVHVDVACLPARRSEGDPIDELNFERVRSTTVSGDLKNADSLCVNGGRWRDVRVK